MGKKIRVWLAFILSSIISVVIVVHSASYLIKFFADESQFLIISALLLIEIGYVVLPYVAAWNTNRNKYWDNVAIAVLFVLSVIPATLQTTSGFVKTFEETIIEEPIAPKKPTIMMAYLSEIALIEKQIDSNLKTIDIMVERNYLTKSRKISEFNNKLISKKTNLLENMSKVEAPYLELEMEYSNKLIRYRLDSGKQWLEWVITRLQLLWSFLLIAILQLVNARFVIHGTALMAMSDEPTEVDDEKNKNLINKQELLSVDSLLNKVKVTGIGRITVEKFINVFEIWDEPTLLEFVNSDKHTERIEKIFPQYSAKRLKRFCDVIRKRLDDKAKHE